MALDSLDELPVMAMKDFEELPVFADLWRDEFMTGGKYWQWRKRGKDGKKQPARYGGKRDLLSPERCAAYDKRSKKLSETREGRITTDTD
jgi:hypothetical protein